MSTFECARCGHLLRPSDTRCPKCGSTSILMDGMSGRELLMQERYDRVREMGGDQEWPEGGEECD